MIPFIVLNFVKSPVRWGHVLRRVYGHSLRPFIFVSNYIVSSVGRKLR